jgi:hypothetical protein
MRSNRCRVPNNECKKAGAAAPVRLRRMSKQQEERAPCKAKRRSKIDYSHCKRNYKDEKAKNHSHRFGIHLQCLVVAAVRVLKIFVRGKLHSRVRGAEMLTPIKKRPYPHQSKVHHTKLHFEQHAMQSNAVFAACCASGAEADHRQSQPPHASAAPQCCDQEGQ